MSDAEYTVSVAADEADLKALRHEWDELLERSSENRPFSTWTWASCWWDHHRAGKRLFIVTLRDGEGRLTGLAPFYREWLVPGVPVRRLRLMGAGNSDYLDLILTRGKEEDLAKALVAFLAAHGRAWQLLTLEEVPGDSPALAAFRSAAAAAGWPSVLLPQEVCPYLELPGTWEELRATLGKKTRKHLDYYRRRIEKESQFEIRLVEDPAALPAAMAEMFRLHQRRWQRRGMPGSFALPSVRRFHLDVARRFLDEGRLRLYLAYANGECVASQYSFRTSAGTFYYSGGFDPAWSWAGVGSLVVAHSIQRAIAEGLRLFDFLRGAEDYKYRWTSAERRNHQFSAVRPGSGARPLLKLLDLQNRAERSKKGRIEAQDGHLAAMGGTCIAQTYRL